MASRTFHVIFVPDGLVASSIDAIRVLANPAEKHRAHITVRGPYRRRGSRSGKVSRFIEGSEVNIYESGNFFDCGQNTVYLRCVAPELETVWYKPDYGFNPHITLYDGSSHEFARELWEVVSMHTYNFSFIAGPLTPLVSSRRHRGIMTLKADLDLRLLREVTGEDLNEATVESLGKDRRLRAIDKLCDYLSRNGTEAPSLQSIGDTHGARAIEIKEVNLDSQVLSQIKALAKRNSATLGFLPEGAFDAYAQRGWVLVAIAEGDVVGYVIYRISRMRAVLVHLCTDQKHRGRGIAKQLFRTVADRTKDLHGILANTRRDFPAHRMWPRLGFAAIGEGRGRGKSESVLTRWWYEHPHPTLFSSRVSYLSAQSLIDIAIDIDVFYDLVIPSSKEGEVESRLLKSDWLGDEIQLCVTPELFNEINRLANRQVRREQTALAHEFKRLSGVGEVFDRLHSLLISAMGEGENDRQSSMLRHLAHTAAANVQFFATRESRILEFRSEIERQIGVTPIRPMDLVIEVDQVRNIASYQPARFGGTTLQVRRVERQQRQELEEIFVNDALGESKLDVQRRLSAILPSRGRVESAVVFNDGKPIALFGLDRSDKDVLEVPCLRLRHGPISRTLARQIVTLAVESSIASKLPITAVTDDWLEPYVEEALADAGFAKAGAHWLKLNYVAIGNEDCVSAGLGRLLEQVRGSGLHLPRILRSPLQAGCRLTATETVLMERALRPLKLTNDTLETLVIPVMPRWAEHLFDSGLADQTLFGAQPDLLLHWENAYYRSSRSLGDISAPFRILWYVSQDGRYMGTGQIRAYSVCSSVEVLPASQAHSRYNRLGVYELQQVLSISRGDPDGLVMVIRFCDIETLKNPIDRKRFSAVLECTDQKKPSLRGPQRISEAAFAEIYREGQS